MSNRLKAVGNTVLPSLEAVARTGMGMDASVDTGKDMRSLLSQIMLASGLNTIHLINDTQTAADWVENNGGVFDVAVNAAGRVGTNEIKLTSTAALDGSQFVSTKFIDASALAGRGSSGHGRQQMDWSDTRYLCFWVDNQSNGDFSDAGEMKVTIVNNGVVQAQVNVQAIVDDVHQLFEIDMVAEGWDKTMVEELRFYGNVGIGEDLFINDIKRYDLSYNSGPAYGCMFPISDALSLVDGQIVDWGIDGLVIGSASIMTLGPVKLFKDGKPVSSATGDAQQTVWGMVPGIQIMIVRVNDATIAGEGLEWQTTRLVEGVATGVDEFAFAKGLEAAGAQFDDIFAIKAVVAGFIS